LIEVASELQLSVLEDAFTPAEACAAREAFISSATNPATSVVAVDDKPIGDGRPGPVVAALRAAYLGKESAE
jgi:D-alanine transaminase